MKKILKRALEAGMVQELTILLILILTLSGQFSCFVLLVLLQWDIIELKQKLGDKVYEHVGELVELGMIQRERKGRSFELSVTEAFMEYFGINAENQNELKAYLEQALTS